MSTVESPNYDRSDLAGRIKAAMKRRRLTMRGLSELTDIPYGTLEGWLRGRHPVPAHALGRVADALDVSADWLIFERPATFDKHSLAVAISILDEVRKAAKKVGAEMSALALAQQLADFYTDNYKETHEAGDVEADSD